MSGRGYRSDALRRIQRYWLRSCVLLVTIGCGLGPLGVGGSRWGLVAFAVAFLVLSVPLGARGVRPGVKLIDTMPRTAAVGEGLPPPQTR